MPDHDFTYEEADAVIWAANQRRRAANPPNHPLGRLLLHHPLKICALIAILAAVLTHYFFSGPTALPPSPFAAVSIRHTLPNQVADSAAAHLAHLPDTARLLDKHGALAEQVKLDAQQVCQLTTTTANATLQSALETVAFAPDVLRSAARGIDATIRASRTALDVLRELVLTVEEAAGRVPLEAGAALAHLNETLEAKVRGRLETVRGLVEGDVVGDVRKYRGMLSELAELLLMVSASPKRQTFTSYLRNSWHSLFGDDVDPLPPPATQQLSDKLTTGPVLVLANALLILHDYAALLRSLDEKLREDGIGDDARWTELAALRVLADGEGEAGKGSGSGNVARAVVRNLEVLVGALDELQLRF